MAKIEDLIVEISNERLRAEISAEVQKLKSEKKFGLVFENHVPELSYLYGVPIKVGASVVKRGAKGSDVFRVTAINSDGVTIAREADNTSETLNANELTVVKRFGEAIYPALIPVEGVTKNPEKPYHTIINSDNYHALQLLLYCYEGKFDVIYLDPPYNTGARDWKYNNDYVDVVDRWRHSKWLSMMKKRLSLAKRLIKPDGVMIITIDDNELFNLGLLIDEVFEGWLKYVITIEHNKRGRRGINFAKTNEYALFFTAATEEVIQGEKSETLFGGESRNLRRTGSGSKRHERWRKFYPIYVNEKTLEVVKAGDSIPLNEQWKHERDGDLITVFPIDEEGKEKNWHYGLARTRESIAQKQLYAKKQKYGIQVYYTLRTKESKRLKTVWSKPTLDASTHGSELLYKILGDSTKFDYPKSLYAVEDCLKAVCDNRPNALVLDFFAGSGTTLHATALLNTEDGGNRRCVLVTNNEVDEKTAKQLNKAGFYAGDVEFEQQGICESVTSPRCKYVINGQRDDGTQLQGKYINGRDLKKGFDENLAYFKLDFLDPNDVAFGVKFESVLPILWLMAGAKGSLAMASDSQPFYLPIESPFAVLLKESYFEEFKQAVSERSDLTHIFLITDSESAFREMSAELGSRCEMIMLYKNYLDNFRLNIDRNA